MLQKYKTPIALFLLIGLSFLLAFPDVKYDQLLTDEDSWIENISAIAFLLAALFFFSAFWQSKGNGIQIGKLSTNRNLIFLGIGLLFFVAFGEEISWGQRIFGWSTPEGLAAVNYQQETNIHNLDFFTFKDETGEHWYSPLLVLNAGRIFFYFWFSFMVAIPLLYQFSAGFRSFSAKLNIPIVPLWMGLLMIANLVISKVYKIFLTGADYSGSIDEIMEGNYAILIGLMGAYFFFKARQNKSIDLSIA